MTQMTSALTRLPNGNVELTVSIPWKKITIAYEDSLSQLAKKAEIKGFRKGKAPLKIVETKIGKQAIYEQVLKTIIPDFYSQAVKEQKIRPIVSPQVRVTSLEENKDWQIVATTCELPKVNLGDYKGEARSAMAAEKIWVPGEDKKKSSESKNAEERLSKIFKVLLEKCQVDLPEILISDEVNRMLARLIDQTNKLGLTVEQYLASVNKNIDQLKAEYKKQAEETLKLELILSAIADDQKTTVSEQEIEQMLGAIPDEKTRLAMNTPEQRIYLKQLLRKRHVIDNLTSL